ncbi:MAG: SMI1/KNR4 family protein [Nitrospira sp.]|nr:SMI1/KNR4 family protein [Nitrospira sp.]
MYEWLEEELRRVQWPKFHHVSKAGARELIDPTLPASYREFVKKFGAAKLYRRNDHYQIGVLYPPELVRIAGSNALLVGYSIGIDVFFRMEDLAEGQEARIYELIDGNLEEVAFDFRDWLETCATDARDEYSSSDWARIEAGPQPFTRNEKAIIEARACFSVQLIGIGEQTPNTLRVKIRNGSDRFLQWLTIGVRHKDGVVEARLPVDVSSIKPGEERILDVPGYVTLSARDAVVFELPPPTPAERDLYSELATSGPMKR